MKNLLAAIFLLVGLAAHAQSEERTIQYGGMQHLGIRMESSNTQPYINIINGIRYKRYFFGVGASYDYTFRGGWGWNAMPSTAPIYLTARHYFFKKKKVFVLAEAGTNIIAGNGYMTKQGENNFEYYEKKWGQYYSIGAGVKAKIGKEIYYTVDLCYNYKHTAYDRFVNNNVVGGWSIEENIFEQQRVLLRLGIEIF